MRNHKWDQREGSITHVDSPDGHRYFIISDREFTDCGGATESRYMTKCRCDACTDVHAEKERARRERARARRRSKEEKERPRLVLEENLRNLHRDLRGDA